MSDLASLENAGELTQFPFRSTLSVVREQAADARINPTFPAFAAEVFDRAIAAGLGDQEPAAIAKQ